MKPDPLTWLESQTEYPKVYWQSRDQDLILAGAGCRFQTDQIPVVNSHDRFFGGISFCQKTWGPEFPSSYFFIPKVIFEGDKRDSPVSSLPAWHNRTDSITEKEWILQIEQTFTHTNPLEKIVYARETTLTFEDTLNPLQLLRKLREKSIHTTLFAFQMSPQSTFIGATPEKLYNRRGNQIQCDVLAATAPLNEAHLLKNPKERYEFNCVKDTIHRTMTALCDQLILDQDRVFTTSTLHHLYTTIQGTLKPHVTDEMLIRALHPTPAVGGLPKSEALQLLSQEKLTRGWYAAPIGWIGHREADLAVAIRSARIEGKKAHLYAAAGITIGSNPQLEWKELEHKISPILSCFIT